jgi:hypothetical protein
MLRDPCLRRDDREEAFFDTLSRERARVRMTTNCDVAIPQHHSLSSSRKRGSRGRVGNGSDPSFE